VRGRINLNSETNGPLGDLQSPAFFALFKGLNVTNMSTFALEPIADYKITNIVGTLGAYRDSVPGAAFDRVGQICDVTNPATGFSPFTTDQNGTDIPYTEDALRESIVRDISNLVTTRADSGASEIIAWGQVLRNGKVPVCTVQIRAKYQVVGTRIKLTKFQYVKQ
jgi:hypothetical protein